VDINQGDCGGGTHSQFRNKKRGRHKIREREKGPMWHLTKRRAHISLGALKNLTLWRKRTFRWGNLQGDIISIAGRKDGALKKWTSSTPLQGEMVSGRKGKKLRSKKGLVSNQQMSQVKRLIRLNGKKFLGGKADAGHESPNRRELPSAMESGPVPSKGTSISC